MRPMIGLLASCLVLTATAHAAVANPPKAKWLLTWSDEFDGVAGAAPDPAKWGHDVGPKWYNDELEEYTAGAKNTFLDGQGHLVIEARNEGTAEKPHYTSGRVKTAGLFSQAYGRFEARIKVPDGKGIWPAFWMLGDDIGRAGWPGGGELDILEIKGSRPDVVMGTAHGPGYSGGDPRGGTYKNPEGSVADGYHTYAVEWAPNSVKWYFDDTNYFTLTPTVVGNHRWVYDHPFFMILNLAVGGNFDGNPDSTTVFPKRMFVDYVRVYRQTQ